MYFQHAILLLVMSLFRMWVYNVLYIAWYLLLGTISSRSIIKLSISGLRACFKLKDEPHTMLLPQAANILQVKRLMLVTTCLVYAQQHMGMLVQMGESHVINVKE